MANTYRKKIAGGVGVTLTDVYVANSGVQGIAIGMTVANISTAPISANVKVFSAATSNSAFIIRESTIAIGGTLVPLGGDQKLILEAGDKVQVQMSAASSGDVIISVLEIS
jgi:hypothetical protein